MMMSGWVPPCHEGAADCRLDRFLLSVSSCTSSLAHLHADAGVQSMEDDFGRGNVAFLSIEMKRVSRVIFILHGSVRLVAFWLIEHSAVCVEWTQLVNLH